MYINNSIYKNDIEKIISKEFEIFKNKTFFITGASGLVGSFLIDTLMYLNKYMNSNIKIIATFTSMNSFSERFPSYQNKELLKPIIQDITSPIKISENINYIINAASNTHPLLYATKPVETIILNTLGTLNVLKLAKEKNAKLIQLSTLEVYGENQAIESFKEKDIGLVNFNLPRSCYPESKRLAETLCHSYIQEFNVYVNIARLGYIYGPSVKLNSSKADVQFLNKALNKQSIVLKSSGKQKRSYCYVADVILALLLILIKGENGEVYNVASKMGNTTLLDYAKTLATVANVDITFEQESEIEKLGGSKVLNSTLNSDKLEKIGWTSKFTLQEGIESTYKIKKEVINA